MPIFRAENPKPYTWENIEVGDEYGPVEAVVSELKLKLHAFAVDDYGDWYFKDSPFGGRIGHPTLLANDILMLFTLGYDIGLDLRATPGGLHAKNEIEFFAPVRIGQNVTIRGANVEKYQRRGQNYRVLEGQVLDAGGQPLLRMRATETVGLNASTPVGKTTSTPPPNAITGEVPTGAPEVNRASLNTPIGGVLPALTKQTSLEQSIAFSGFMYGWVEGGAREMSRNIHTDRADAQARGLPDPIVQALCSTAYLSELCTNFFGPEWITSGRLSLVFIRPVIVRDTITAQGMVTRRVEEGNQTRLELEVWCKNQRGELTTVGRASAAHRARSR